MSDETLNWLKEHGKTIGEEAQNGNHLAKQIVNLYGMYYRFPEHVALALLEAAIDDYRKHNPQA